MISEFMKAGTVKFLNDKWYVEYEEHLPHAGLSKKGTGPGKDKKFTMTQKIEVDPSELALCKDGQVVTFKIDHTKGTATLCSFHHMTFKESYMVERKAPFNKETIEVLQSWQTSGMVHPYTCDRKAAECEVNVEPRDYAKDGVLIPTEEGWVCPCCKYTQSWF